jgi:hypothetical protein
VLDYDPENSLKEAEEKDKRYKNFFGSLGALIRDENTSGPQKVTAEDI